jgi:hypothetical protein
MLLWTDLRPSQYWNKAMAKGDAFSVLLMIKRMVNHTIVLRGWH